MGIFNDNILNPHTFGSTPGPVGPPGPPGLKGPPGPGFKLTRDGNFNINNKRLTNMGAPTDDDDATTKEYVDDELNSKIANSQIMGGNAEAGKLVKYLPDKGMITPKMYIEDEFGDSVIIKSEDQDYDDVHLYLPNLKNYDGRSGRRKSNIMVNSIDNNMTGKIILPSGNLIVKDGEGSANQTVLNRADLDKLYGSVSGADGITYNKVALYSSDLRLYALTYAIKNENNHDYVILRCRDSSGWRSLYIPSLNSDADIVINQTNQTISGDKTFSSAITMTQEGSVNNHLVTKGYVDSHYENYLKVDGSNMMTGDLNMNNHKIMNLEKAVNDNDAVNKKYVYNNFIARESGLLNGNLNANQYKIENLKLPTTIGDAVNKQYCDDNFLKVGGGNTMLAILDMNNNQITNLSQPIDDESAATKKYVDSKTIIKPTHHLTNSFQYLMNDINEISTEYGLIADKIDDLSWSPHENKKVLYFKAVKDGLNYRYRLGFQMTQSSPIANTIAIEQLFNNENYWNKAQISINGTGIAIESSHTNKFHFGNYYYIKTIVQLKRLTAPEHQLYYTTHIDNVTSSPMQLQQYVLAYGVNSFMNDVDSIVYNIQLFKNINDKMQMQVEINMNNNKIVNLAPPTNDNDAVNLNYLERSFRINRYNIPIINGLSIALLTSLLSVDVDENNKIAGITDIINEKNFIQTDDNMKPSLMYNKNLEKYYAHFPNDNSFLEASNIKSVDIFGSNGNTAHFFIVFKPLFKNRNHNLIDYSSFSITLRSTGNILLHWGNETYQTDVGIQNKIILLEVHIERTSIYIINGNNISNVDNHNNGRLSETIATLHIGFSSNVNVYMDLYALLIYNKSLNNNEKKLIRRYLENEYKIY